MPLTDHDALARHLLTVAIERRHFSGAVLTQMAVDLFKHCLDAIEDRAKLVEAVTMLYECKSEVVGEPAIWWADNEAQRVTGEAYDAARRHMEGK